MVVSATSIKARFFLHGEIGNSASTITTASAKTTRPARRGDEMRNKKKT